MEPLYSVTSPGGSFIMTAPFETLQRIFRVSETVQKLTSADAPLLVEVIPHVCGWSAICIRRLALAIPRQAG